eukprot:CAMPEP_0118981488 /NCGR_PEP_ID=MMETSP1173-20130426/30686_1 /TAXON_ID=1034831 /ORGANISM="Rhizochromulina marina cf, Strain CCMP1243" /LENGTH=65 /DNA_ID=CAMNT_0006931907 /DNA_START=42 /DNA_END=236 /DNA_ORIENTATION=+
MIGNPLRITRDLFEINRQRAGEVSIIQRDRRRRREERQQQRFLGSVGETSSALGSEPTAGLIGAE